MELRYVFPGEFNNIVYFNYSVIDILFFNNTKANRFMRFVTRAKGIYPLKRGFQPEAVRAFRKDHLWILIIVFLFKISPNYKVIIGTTTLQNFRTLTTADPTFLI